MDIETLAPNKNEDGFGPIAWIAAASVVALLVICLVMVLHHRKQTALAAAPPPNTVLPLDAYAGNLAITGIEMSDAPAFGGGRFLYVDGHITNNGAKTVTGITVQTVFANDLRYPPQVETGPLMLIRTRDPEVDTEPVKAEPLKPGDSREFRLIFENVYSDWNQSYPELHVTSVQ